MPRRFGFGLGFNISRLSGLPEPSGFVAKYQSYDVDDFTLVTGSNVSQWDDRSANANHLTQGTSTNQPILTQDANRFNNTVDFGPDDFMTGLPPQSGDFTYVFKGLTTASNGGRVFLSATTNSNFRIDGSDNLLKFRGDDGNSIAFSGVTISSIEGTLALKRVGNDYTAYINGVQFGNTKTNTANFEVQRVGHTSAAFNGSLQELYVYDRALTQDEINWFSYLRDENNNISPVPPLLPS